MKANSGDKRNVFLVVAVYNYAVHDKFIASVVTQIYQNWELIVWDTALTDVSDMISQS